MQTQTEMILPTSSQVDPKLKIINPKRKNEMPFIINGCSVSFTSYARNTDEPIKAVKEILLSAYRTRTARC